VGSWVLAPRRLPVLLAPCGSSYSNQHRSAFLSVTGRPLFSGSLGLNGQESSVAGQNRTVNGRTKPYLRESLPAGMGIIPQSDSGSLCPGRPPTMNRTNSSEVGVHLSLPRRAVRTQPTSSLALLAEFPFFLLACQDDTVMLPGRIPWQLSIPPLRSKSLLR
jgi:hypothetical protein